MPRKDWTVVEQIQAHLNTLVCGDPRADILDYIADTYLCAAEPLNGLSLGSGRGNVEIQLASRCRFDKLLGYELSGKLVRFANKLACGSGRAEVVFERGDVLRMRLSENQYDVVLGWHSLHHFRCVEDILRSVARSLKPSGLLLLFEYVGPNRFQWTEEQLAESNSMLQKIPLSYRKRWGLDEYKAHVHRPGLLRMLLADPSEAVESEVIRPALAKFFAPVRVVEVGGALLHPVFHDIGGNFPVDDPRANEIVEGCIRRESRLMQAGAIKSDFLLGVYSVKR